MFVIHGTYTPQKKRGLAADVCPRCVEVRPFLVTDHYQVTHLYFIPLGSGTYQGSSQECQHCRLRVLCRPSIYDRILSPKEVDGLSEEQFIVATNPGLALPEPQRAQWIEAVSDLTLFVDVSKGETLPDLALKRLFKANLQPDRMRSFAERFDAWEDASLMARLALLTEAAAAVGGGQELRTAYYFAQTAMQAAPNGAGCLLAIPLGALLGAAWIGLLIALIDAGFDIGNTSSCPPNKMESTWRWCCTSSARRNRRRKRRTTSSRCWAR
jgi:hypothetical protein